MKKYFVAIALGLMTLCGMTSCSSNSPEGVVKKQMACLQNKDAEGLVELLDLPKTDGDAEKAQKDKAELVSMIESKGFKTIDQKGGIKSYEILDVEAPENPEAGARAVVTVKTFYNNGTEEEEKVKLTMDDAGKWKIALGK